MALVDDYRPMVSAGMLIGEPPGFTEIVAEFCDLKLAIDRLS